jgi:hypothetical protein
MIEADTEREAKFRRGFLLHAESIGGALKDDEGRLVLRGLSHEESQEIAADFAAFQLGRPPVLDREQLHALDARWLKATNEAVAAMIESRGQPVN